ncbi:MAG: hypothetical protein ABDI20_08625, partial [Candidatus Bipolaricaulaceae bacterium]
MQKPIVLRYEDLGTFLGQLQAALSPSGKELVGVAQGGAAAAVAVAQRRAETQGLPTEEPLSEITEA